MKKTIYKLIPIIIIIVLLLASLASKEGDRDKILMLSLQKKLEKWHYSQKKFDDEYSRRAYNLFIQSLDYNKRYFLQSDLKQLEVYQTKIDDELNQRTTEFFDLASRLYRQRLEETRSLAAEILKKPFTFTNDESLETDPKKRSFAKNSTELREYWRKLLKYQTLLEYLDLTQNETDDVKPVELESKARQNVAKSIKRSLDRLLQETDIKRFDRYLNAITGSFDPHTSYLPPYEKENFDIAMSGTLEGIGALLQESGEYIKVAEIIPGSAAWRQKELQAEDIILKVAQGEGEPVDVVNMPVNDVVKLIRGKKGSEVRLTVKKPDGRIMVIPITRDVVVVEETYAKSAIIENERAGKKFGYLYLPEFYRDFQNSQARNATDDIERELRSVMGENVDGIILDLRNNGGGALEDAVNISGLFIKNGPVVQVRDSTGRSDILMDPDPDIVYNGPLVILINSFSASASEILAAALQDYWRAVIVGSPQSFGKGTVQTLLEVNMIPEEKASGSLKLTIQKFYRVTGESTQSKGVASDIVLPGIYNQLQMGEKDLEYFLPWDVINPLPFKKWENRPDLTELAQRSAERIKDDLVFKYIDDYAVKIEEQNTKTLQSLLLSKMQAQQESFKAAADRLDKIQTEQPFIKVTLPSREKTDVDSDPARVEKTKDWLKEVNRDRTITEATYILNDILEISTKK